MHEMAIAEGILDISLNYAKREKAKKIACVSLLLGEMSGVETEALTFCFESLVKDTIAEGSSLVINRIPLMGRCKECANEEHIEHYNFVCHKCGSTLEVISGRELQVEYIDME